MAMALELRRHKDQVDRCRTCGTTPGDWHDADGRVVAEPSLEESLHRCEGCRRLAKAEAQIPDDERKFVRPRFQSREHPAET